MALALAGLARWKAVKRTGLARWRAVKRTRMRWDGSEVGYYNYGDGFFCDIGSMCGSLEVGRSGGVATGWLWELLWRGEAARWNCDWDRS